MDHGELTVRFGPPPLDSDAKQFHLTVCDSGPGIPIGRAGSHLQSLFHNKRFTGTGLGLAIVHRVDGSA